MSFTLQSSSNNEWLEVSDQDVWEKELESLPGIQRITENESNLLRQMLASHENADSFLTSANYYLFTGRNGLWAFRHQDDFMFLCWHPNVPGRIILFPQLNDDGSLLIERLLSILPPLPKGFMVARVKQGEDCHFNTRIIDFHEYQENMLDWQYPVHILSTRKVANLAGHEFMYIRNRLRQTDKYSISVTSFDATHHSRSMENLLHRWASQRAVDRVEYENLYAPYETLFFMSMNPMHGMSGLMISVDGKMEALGLWDVSGISRIANLFVNLCNTDIKGLSELLIVKCCETLRGQNIEYLNLGGSETAGLDNFKRKFQPAASLELKSIEIDNVRHENAKTRRLELKTHV